MTRDRYATQELASVLDLLTEVEKASALSIPVPPQLPPRKAPAPQAPTSATPGELFGPVRVEGEDQLARTAGEDKVAIFRRKVKALEDRLREIQGAWNAREGEVEQARQDARDEKQRREQAEESITKLNAFLQAKKKEFEEYHGRVQEALREQLRREQEAAREHARQQEELMAEQANREKEALREHARVEQEAQRDQARREQQLREQAKRTEQEMLEQAKRTEHELLEQAKRTEHELLEQAKRTEQLLLEQAKRAERAEREVAELQRPAPPPPPSLLTLRDIEELSRHINIAGRGIASILKGRVDPEQGTEALREALRVLKESIELLSAVRREAAAAD